MTGSCSAGPIEQDNSAHRPDRHRWEQQYSDGCTPWDTNITPPEVQTFWHSGLLLPKGTALDMGCGTGTNVAYLARLGLNVIGLELSVVALTRARARLRSIPPAVAARAFLVQSDVSRLPLRGVEASYILDIGCLHTLPRSRRKAYACDVMQILVPGGYYHLYAHNAEQRGDGEDVSERGLHANEVADLFTPELTLITVLRGTPETRETHWYLLHRTR